MEQRTAPAPQRAPILHRKKADYAYEQLRENILDGRYPPGQRMILAELSMELGLSHMPIREALLRLESEGLLVSEPHKGMRVTELSVEDARQLFEVRSTLEGLAVFKAAKADDPDLVADLTAINDSFEEACRTEDFGAMGAANSLFHQRILQAADNQQLSRLLNDIWLNSSSYRMGYRLISGHAEETIEEHRQVIQALRNRNPIAARAILQHHIERGGDSLVAMLADKQARV